MPSGPKVSASVADGAGAAADRFASVARSDAFADWLASLAVELCALDTSPKADVSAAAAVESRVFDVLERELAALRFPSATWRRVPIDRRIASHRYYSAPYYTQAAGATAPLSVDECYAGRCNLRLFLPGEERWPGGRSLAVNAHVDVVAPYFPPRVEGSVVFGRGACDDKGNAAAFLGALKLLRAGLGERPALNRALTGMFVIDEETGGNGSLSCALDAELRRRYDSMVVLECADLGIYPGNRGCVWYKIEGRAKGVNLFEASAYMVEELEREGRAIWAESDHPLFPHRPVQTCHGIIGHSGEHPSRINGDVSFRVELAGGRPGAPASALVRRVLDEAVGEYVRAYGDKTQVVHPGDSRPVVPRHYDLTERADGWGVRVWGSTGHMGAIEENDGAITKMATMVRRLVAERAGLEASAGAAMHLALEDWPDSASLLLEGGQGFLPTHRLEDVERRMGGAVQRGLQRYGQQAGTPVSAAEAVQMTFAKLRNAAFAGDPSSVEVRHALEAARAAGVAQPDTVRGWDVSCDARLFACEYPGLPVLTMGAGALRHAHADDEQINIRDMARMAELLARFILRQTGTRGTGGN